jgi:hypothetical protein
MIRWEQTDPRFVLRPNFDRRFGDDGFDIIDERPNLF